jgi:hypothetical protein
MGAERADERGHAVRIPERHQIFAEQAHADRRAVAIGQFFGQQRRQPVAAEQLAHRGAGADPGQALVFGR